MLWTASFTGIAMSQIAGKPGAVNDRIWHETDVRGHMAEFGLIAPTGIPRVKELLAVIADEEDPRLPSIARKCLKGLVRKLSSLDQEIVTIERRIMCWHRSSEVG